eukprot:7377441-Prymnesium_polylepis.2
MPHAHPSRALACGTKPHMPLTASGSTSIGGRTPLEQSEVRHAVHARDRHIRNSYIGPSS